MSSSSAHLLAVPLPAGQAEADVLLDRQVGKQTPVLGHEADATPVGATKRPSSVDDFAAEADRAAVGPFEAGDHPQAASSSRFPTGREWT